MGLFDWFKAPPQTITKYVLVIESQRIEFSSEADAEAYKLQHEIQVPVLVEEEIILEAEDD